jgi:hypothetical protein
MTTGTKNNATNIHFLFIIPPIILLLFNYILISCFIFVNIHQEHFGKMAYNVPAVTEGFLCPIRKNAKHFYGHKKLWRNKTMQRAKPEHGFV